MHINYPIPLHNSVLIHVNYLKKFIWQKVGFTEKSVSKCGNETLVRTVDINSAVTRKILVRITAPYNMSVGLVFKCEVPINKGSLYLRVLIFNTKTGVTSLKTP